MGLLNITPERKAYWLGRFGTDSPRIGQVKEDEMVCFHEGKHRYDPRTEQCVRCGDYRSHADKKNQ
jgi:hypothetical protein